MTPSTVRQRLWLTILERSPLIFFAVVALGFSLASEHFFTVPNLLNLLTQSAQVGILAVGMTFVLLLGKVDLSVGSMMFVGGAICGKLLEAGAPFPLALLGMLLATLAFGAVNAVLILRFGIVSFVVTLATLYIGRGLGYALTQTRPTPVPPFEAIAGWSLFGINAIILLFAAVVLVAHGVLRLTPLGRQLYALGNDEQAARRAGLPSTRLTAFAFLAASLCAGLAAMAALAQAPTVSPDFGSQMEFTAIAAAVLGGTSLFGGRGNVLPGAVLGAVLLQLVTNGLNLLNVDPYLYPIAMGTIIFLAVLTDSKRHQLLLQLFRRRIRGPAAASGAGFPIAE
jgi:ribose transport system permease protein